MLLVIATAFLLRRSFTEGAPLALSACPTELPLHVRDDPISTDDCNNRTIWNILWSCLATTFTCTWLSVHPNVPFKNEGKWAILGRRLFLMFFSILAPEVMVMWAFKQWRGAVKIKEVVNDANPESCMCPSLSRISNLLADRHPSAQPWTTTHGHFLQMGGFRISMRDEGEPESRIPHISKRNEEVVEGLLTFDTFKSLLGENLIAFPKISEEEINDKSKGDALSKGIAAIQLAWFITQIIARGMQGLAITELELTTAALAGLNSAMYFFWWNKPLDVRCPIIIETKEVKELVNDTANASRWNFSESEFSIRRYIRESITGFLLNTVTHTDEFVRSLPRRLVNLASSLKRAICCGAPERVMQLFGPLMHGVSRHQSHRQCPIEEKPGGELAVSRTQLSSQLILANSYAD